MNIKKLSLGNGFILREKTMKKLLGVSLVAMLAVTPMMAMAAGEVYATSGNPAAATSTAGTAENLKASASAPYASVDAQPTTTVASTSFVRGAYNAAIQAVNKVADDSVQKTALSDKSLSINANELKVNDKNVLVSDSVLSSANLGTSAVTTAAISAGAVTTEKLDSTLQSAITAAGTALQSGDNISLLSNDAGYLTSSTVAGALTATIAVATTWNSDTTTDNTTAVTIAAAE